MDNQSARRATIILGVIMIIAIGSSTILPLFSNTAVTQPTDAPTATIVPTFPPEMTDFSTIQFTQDYLHPTGLFSVSEPTGWTIGSQPVKADGAEVSMNNADIFSVIQVSLQIAPAPLQSMDDLDAIYTTTALNQSWSNYRSPRETARSRTGDNKLIIDFELQNSRGQVFLARQTSWYDTDWVYSIRVVTPNNQIDLLKYMMDKEIASFKPYRMFAGTPGDWSAYFDQVNRYIIRYPTTWTLSDSAPGLPASIESDKGSLRLEAQSVSAPLNEDAARAWVASSRSGAAVTSVQPVTRDGQAGFSVAYTYTDPDGDANSGLALLLNAPDNKLDVANLRIFEANVDLNTDTAQVSHDELVKILGTFHLLSGLNVPVPTATPLPTLAATATPEATTEATSTAVAPTATAAPTDTAIPPTNTVAPSTTPVPPTATTVPSSTPVPTNTAVPPTATIVPSSTPAPSKTPVPPTATTEATAEATAG
jgi:hypothetical protein